MSSTNNAAMFEQWYRLIAPTIESEPPPLQTEVRFEPKRRWRADFGVGRVLVEIEGGTWSGGRHTRGKGYLADCEKYNRAAELGFVVLRYTYTMLEDDPQKVIEQVLNVWRGTV